MKTLTKLYAAYDDPRLFLLLRRILDAPLLQKRNVRKIMFTRAITVKNNTLENLNTNGFVLIGNTTLMSKGYRGGTLGSYKKRSLNDLAEVPSLKREKLI